MLHLSQWTSQFVQNISMTIRHPLSLDPHIVQGKTSREKPHSFFICTYIQIEIYLNNKEHFFLCKTELRNVSLLTKSVCESLQKDSVSLDLSAAVPMFNKTCL